VNPKAFFEWRASWSIQSPPLVIGVLNITADSFSDGGQYLAVDDALQHAEALIAAGADVLDIGGESSRPFATPISVDEELARVIPVIEALCARHAMALSIDTYKPQVMAAAVAAGACIINDITALQTPGALATVAGLDAAVCLMHMQGTPQTMQQAPQYERPIEQVISDFFAQRMQACLAAGVSKERVMIDPGFGFGKTDAHNLRLTRQLPELLAAHGVPLWFGCSRKATLGSILQRPVTQRLAGGLGLAVYAMLHGASIIRTHDVAETRDALNIVNAVVHAMA
jgi:dihydropteroate synthase